MSTPAKQRGIIENVTQLKIDAYGARDLIWMLVEDDNSNNPFFSTVDGSRRRECWTLSDCIIIAEQFTPAPVLQPPPAPIEAPVPQIPTVTTVWQQRAIECFSNMHAAAVSYRATKDPGNLRPAAGICDNIERFTSNDDEMVYVKDNLIRTLPSYSGAWHYPVKHTASHESAERAWDYTENKWLGDYGANRLEQLGELVEAIKTRWDDNLIIRQSPAYQRGIKVGDIVWHRERNELITFETDDFSADPYFTRPDGVRFSTHLDNIECDITKVLTGDPIEVLIARAKAHILKRKEIAAQIAVLEKQAAAEREAINLIDIELAHTFGVKRIEA